MNAGKRIRREAEQLKKKPCREFIAYPSDDNEFSWMFTMRGPEGTPYEEGVYHGKLILPLNYPYGPPDVMLVTPNGRFETNLKICLSEVTSYHPENWQPSWGVHTVLHALRGFMNTPGNNAIGAIEYPESERRRLAKQSRTWVSPEGASMAEHLKLLDDSPHWAERVTTSSSPLHTKTPPVSPQVDPLSPVAPPPVSPQPAAEEAVPVPTPEPAPVVRPVEHIPQGSWQVQENSLNNFIVMLLIGIIAILSKKYIENEGLGE
eukprot:TRINITY_DN41_c0_g1_i1.p1 TRINITY_DN41_c0_g1~~TRINITY_DN41_c0_g1_i1.p1  ORF type:complete len:262 (+),score=31.65 TRINITY_DN41_c0_g1_i1:71-856(+)